MLERLQNFFDGLATDLTEELEAQRKKEEELEARLDVFFAGMAPAIAVAVEAQKVLDRVAATNFSVFDYFNEKEIRVSSILADLLRPDGSHGQGPTFLRLFLGEIDRGGKEVIRKLGAYRSLEKCSVYTEYRTSEGRSIDIVLKLGDMWIGIENKPWAGEQPDQVQHYLEFLQQKDAQACVLYLSGSGDDSETINDRDHYLTIPYGHRKGSPSLAHWIADCRGHCEADRVRWFLKDLLEYIAWMFYSEPSEEQF